MADETTNDDDMANLLAHLEQCYEMTLNSLMHCLDEGGDFVKKEHIKILMDCSAISNSTINFLIRDSEYSGDMLSICAFICEDCAESCREFFNDEDMKECAQVCDNCAEACRNMTTEDITDEDEAEEIEKEVKEK